MKNRPANSLKKLIPYAKEQWVAITIAIIFAIVSVYAMVVLPQVLGDATDIVIDGIISKTIYKEVHKGYVKVCEVLDRVDEIKAFVNEVNALEGEERQNYDRMLYNNWTIGSLKNEANHPASKLDQKTKDLILSIPKEANNVRLRKVFGYVYIGGPSYLGLTEVDMTVNEYFEYIEYTYEFNSEIPEQLVDYVLNMKINDEKGYSIIYEYENAKSIGDFIDRTGLTGVYDIPNAYVDVVYGMNPKDAPGINWSKLGEKIIILAILAFVFSVFAYLQGFFLVGAAQRISFKLRNEVNAKLFSMSMSKFERKMKGDYLSVISNDIDNISNAFSQTISQIITTITMMIGVLIMMIRLTLSLSIVPIICIPVSALVMTILAILSKKHYKKMQQSLAEVNAIVEEDFRGHEVIQLFNKQEEHINKFNKESSTLSMETTKSMFVTNILLPISKLISNLCYVAACVFGGISVVNGNMTIGNLQSFIQYLRQFTQPINQLSTQFGAMQQSVASLDRVFELIEAEDDFNEVKIKMPENIKGLIEFDNVSFKYDKELVLKDVSFKVNEGENIAIVGKTGAGKSTINKLLTRFYNLNTGKIFIDNIDISKCDKKEVREHIGIVLQDAWLFEGSIRENIKYGSNASDEDMINAAKQAMIHDFIISLEHGYDTKIVNGATNLSHGQKQLITIARALISKKQILIFDEATSSVDTKTEKEIQLAMNNLLKGRTSIIIAHRLSTIKNADRIIVIDNGQIVEMGTHKELLKAKNVYYNLYKSQFKC